MNHVWLPRAHPNFFKSYLAVLVIHAGIGIQTVIDPAKISDVPGYHYAAQIDPAVWGWTSIAIAALMLAGLFARTFDLARFALYAGLLWSFTFGVFLIEAWNHHVNIGLGAWIWGGFAFWHVSLTLEPPTNPATERV